MNRTRAALLGASLVSVLLFTGMLAAGRGDTDGIYQALGNLAEVVHLIQNEYVEELNADVLSMSLDAGIVESVDRLAAVLPAELTDQYRALLDSPPAFGLVLASRIGTAAVRQAMAGSPAAQSDLESWEVIERVDGINTRGRPLWQLRLELSEKEAAGKAVSLTIVDRMMDERREVVLEPTEWSPATATIEEVDGVTVLTIDSLPPGAADEIAKLVPGDLPLVIDIRSLVWGGELEAIAVADLFVNEGPLGGWTGRRAGSQSYAATEGAIVNGPPMVLVGNDTEGVGEIIAVALQRSGSQLIGNRTIGHAPHMRFINDGDINLWLPVGKWMRADDTAINGNGVEPSEVVAESDGEAEEETDPVLDRALELLREPLEQAA